MELGYNQSINLTAKRPYFILFKDIHSQQQKSTAMLHAAGGCGGSLSFLLQYLTATRIFVKIKRESWTTNICCNNSNIIKLIKILLPKQVVPLFFLLSRKWSQRISLWELLSQHKMSNTIYVDTASFFSLLDRKRLYLVR